MSTTEQEANKCLGQTNCKECPRYMDDCDGKCDGCKHEKYEKDTNSYVCKSLNNCPEV